MAGSCCRTAGCAKAATCSEALIPRFDEAYFSRRVNQVLDLTDVYQLTESVGAQLIVVEGIGYKGALDS